MAGCGSNAFWVYGSTLQMGDAGTPEVFTTIAEVKDMDFSFERDEIEVTSQDSTNGWRQFIPGFRDAGELSFEANWLPTNATHDDVTGLLEQFKDDDCHNFKLILPDTILTIAFTAFVTNFEVDLPLEEQGNLSITLRMTGEPTFTY